MQVQVAPASAFAAQSAASPPATASGDDDGLVTVAQRLSAVASPARAAAAAVADRADAAPASSAGGKVLGLSLPVELTDEASARRTTTTDEKGTWAFADLSPTGRYLIVLSKPGYQTQRFLVTGAEAAAAPLKLEMVPGNGRMSGTVTGSGRAGRRRRGHALRRDHHGDHPHRHERARRATGRSTGCPRRAPTWSAPAAGRLGAQSVLLRLAADGTRSVDLALRSGVATLSGTVRGTDSLGGFGGLGGLTVTASAGEVSRTATTVTGDRAGTFVLPDLPCRRRTR